MEEFQSDNRYLGKGENNPYSEISIMRSISCGNLY